MTLYKFQEEAIAKMLKSLDRNATHACLNSCEMGLGKTIQAIFCAKELKAKYILVLCPAIMRLVWEKEVLTWHNGSKVKVVLTSSDVSKSFDYKDSITYYTICSYDLAHRPTVLSKLSKLKYDLLVLDESHYLKNRRALRTRAALANLWQCSAYKILLSGTPCSVSVTDLFTTCHAIMPEVFKSFTDFAEEYCQKRYSPWTYNHIEYYGIKNAEKLSKIMRDNFYIRYTKEEVLPELPDKIWQNIYLPVKYAIKPSSKSEEETLANELAIMKRCIETGKEPPVPTCLANHLKLQGEYKIEPAAEFIQELLDQGKPVVCYAWHRSVIAGLAEFFDGEHPSVITGETPATARFKAVEDFQSGKTNLFLGNLQAAGTGITLTRASTCVLVELAWSPTVIQQAVDRLHRINQKDTVLIYCLIVEKSIDETLSSVVINRTKLFKTILDETIKISA